MHLYKTFLDDRAVITLTGPDAITLLQGLITQDVDEVTENNAKYGALLTPQGKLITDFFLYKAENAIYLECTRTIRETLLKKLRFYKLRAQVEIHDATEDWQVAVIWPQPADGGGEPPHLPSDNAITTRDPRTAHLGWRLLLPALVSDSLFPEVKAEAVEKAVYTTFLMQSCVPVMEADIISEQTFPLDANLDALSGMNYTKGCFVGQEVSSRMKRKGEIRKRIWGVSSKAGMLQPASSIKAGETTIGEITSANGNIGLAQIRLDRLAKGEGTPLTADDNEVTLHEPSYLKEQT